MRLVVECKISHALLLLLDSMWIQPNFLVREIEFPIHSFICFSFSLLKANLDTYTAQSETSQKLTPHHRPNRSQHL